MADPKIWPKKYYLNCGLMLANFVRWLVNTEGLFTIVEAYDDSHATNARRVPTPGFESTLDNAAFAADGGFSWYNNQALGVDDWIVVQSTNAAGNKFQVVFEFDSSTVIKHHLVPKADFPVGGADVSPPVLSATSIGTTMGTTATAVSFTTKSTGMVYSAVCESDSINLVSDAGAFDVDWMHISKVDGQHPDDTFPFVINDSCNLSYPYGADRYNKLSHIDESLQDAWDVTLASYGGAPLCSVSGLGFPGSRRVIYPSLATVYAVGQMMTFGLKNVSLAHYSEAISGTMADETVMYLGGNASSPRLAFPWDGLTTYP